MKIESPRNPNYAAVVTKLKVFRDLEGCDRVKAAMIYGNQVIVSKDAKEGDIGLFFPVECAISKEFLGNNNQFRKTEMGNVDQAAKGFFEEHGRVKAVKFRGHKSEGFWCPISFLNYLGDIGYLEEGVEFDRIGDHEICKKYVPRRNRISTERQFAAKQPRLEDAIVDGQFRFHLDTAQLRRNIDRIKPDDIISISEKYHGTSAIFSNILVKRRISLFEKVAKWIGCKIQESEYGFTWASRRVVKGINGQSKPGAVHFYETDIWSHVGQRVKDQIPNGFTVYGEIVGFCPNGEPIQQGYHYGCRPNEHQFLVYRVSYTSPDGDVIELSWSQMKDFCQRWGFDTVPELYHGTARDFIHQDVPWHTMEQFHESLLEELERKYVFDQMCPHNNFEVPAEGVVVRIDRYDRPEPYKLKSFAFNARESKLLDDDIIDTETIESDC